MSNDKQKSHEVSDKQSHSIKDINVVIENVSNKNNTANAKNSKSSNESKLTTKDEFGGRKGPEPTRYGDWEKNGRCIDF